MIYNITTFDNIDDAQKHLDEFMLEYGGIWNPYNGNAKIEYDNETKVFKVVTNRNASAD